jgi:type VI secretion system protein ImpC
VAHDRTEVHLTSDFSATDSRPAQDDVFRIAILGDFSERSSATAGEPLARRQAWRIDRDDVDTVLSRMAPHLRIDLGESEPVVLQFSAIDDFHPDQLLRRVPLFQRLLALRNEARTAPERPAAPPPRRGEQPDAVAVDLGSGSLLDRIVEGAAPADASSETPRTRDDLADFVSRAVRSHIVVEKSAEAESLIAKVDGVIAATMRVLLHHPRFQALESLWRGVEVLVRRLDTSETMHVYLIDVTREELIADLHADAEATALRRLLGASGHAWSVIVGSYTFGPTDVDVLTKLAAIGRMSNAPLIAGAHPTFLGIDALAGTDSEDWTLAASPAWDALRASPVSQFLSLAMPRFLVRLPYGQRGEECESMAFEELGDARSEHASFLWGHPGILGALVIADAVANGGAPASRGEIERLPLYVSPVDGEPTAMPCAETTLSMRDAEIILDAGLTPLVSSRDGDTILLPRIQSVASPPRPLSIRTPTA